MLLEEEDIRDLWDVLREMYEAGIEQDAQTEEVEE